MTRLKRRFDRLKPILRLHTMRLFTYDIPKNWLNFPLKIAIYTLHFLRIFIATYPTLYERYK